MNAYTHDEYQIYLKVQHCLYLEDAKNAVVDYIANTTDRYAYDVDDSELSGIDLEEIVSEFEKKQDCNVSYNDTLSMVVQDYMEDLE